MVVSWWGLELAYFGGCTDFGGVCILTLRSPYLFVSLFFHFHSVFILFSSSTAIAISRELGGSKICQQGEERGIRRIEGSKENNREKEYSYSVGK